MGHLHRFEKASSQENKNRLFEEYAESLLGSRQVEVTSLANHNGSIPISILKHLLTKLGDSVSLGRLVGVSPQESFRPYFLPLFGLLSPIVTYLHYIYMVFFDLFLDLRVHLCASRGLQMITLMCYLALICPKLLYVYIYCFIYYFFCLFRLFKAAPAKF